MKGLAMKGLAMNGSASIESAKRTWLTSARRPSSWKRATQYSSSPFGTDTLHHLPTNGISGASSGYPIVFITSMSLSRSRALTWMSFGRYASVFEPVPL